MSSKAKKQNKPQKQNDKPAADAAPAPDAPVEGDIEGIPAEHQDQAKEIISRYPDNIIGIGGDGDVPVFVLLDNDGNVVAQGTHAELIAAAPQEDEAPDDEGEANPETAAQLAADAEARNPKEPKSDDSSDATITDFASLSAALAAKGIEIAKNERVYNLTLTKGEGKSTKQYSVRVDENATDGELASVYHKAIRELS